MAADRPASPDTSPTKPRQDCKTCGSPHRAAIEARLARGESTRKVSAWLAEAHGEAIRHDAIGRHWKAHRAHPAVVVDAAPEPVSRPPAPAPGRIATVTPLRPHQARQQPRQATSKAASADAVPAPGQEPAAEVTGFVPDLAGLDELAREFFSTIQSVGQAIRSNGGEASFAQATLMVGGAREIGKLVQIRNMVLTGNVPGQKTQSSLDGLKALLGNSAPPPIEGDEPDGADDEAEDDVLRPPPRWADGEPDDGLDREVIEAPEVGRPPAATPAPEPAGVVAAEPAMAGPAPRSNWLWMPPGTRR